MADPSRDEKAEFLELVHAYKRCFASTDGQAVLRDLMRNFGYTRKPTMLDTEPIHKMAFREGQRSVLIHVGSYVDVTPESLERFQAGILNEDDDPLLED